MSAIDCPVCGHAVNAEAVRCPECGADPGLPAAEARADLESRHSVVAQRHEGPPPPGWSRGKSLLIWSGALLCMLAVVFLALLVVSPSLRDEVQTLTWPHHFTQQAWDDHPHERYHMALDLSDSGLLEGKSRRWLLEALGPTDGLGNPHGEQALVWPVPSPQRPDDYLIVVMQDGVAVRWGVNSDPWAIY